LDIGQKDAGYVHDSTDVHQEGIIFPGTKLYDAGEENDEIFELIRFNSRMPEQTIGDVHAQIAAIETGKRRLEELHDKYGTGTVNAAIDRILDHGESSARDALRALPDGTWSAVDYADDDGISDDPIRIGVAVTIDGESFTVDFSDSADAVDGPMNVPYGATESMCKLVLKSLTTPESSSNAGQFEPLDVVAPEGSVFNAAYPAPTFTLWTTINAAEAVYEALSEGLPGRVPASSGGDICSMMLVGQDPETGRRYVEGGNEGVGWGATRERDGQNALMHISESTVRNTPIEVIENKAPVRIDELRLRQDSGGAGEHRGGLGVVHTYRFQQSGDALTTVKKTKTEGWGIDGGEPGETNAVVWFPDTDSPTRTGTERKQMGPGDAVSYRTGGGGGYGDPSERDPERVREDVLDGYVSRDAAREAYGVVLTDDLDVDRELTSIRRR
jgi:N-methylhydantoinase B